MTAAIHRSRNAYKHRCPYPIDDNEQFEVDIGEIVEVHDTDPYEGDYEVTPRVYQQVLPTQDKLMINDVTVLEIPVLTVLNHAGGYTATIG